MDAVPHGLQVFIIDPLGADVANPDLDLPPTHAQSNINPFQDVFCGVTTFTKAVKLGLLVV